MRTLSLAELEAVKAKIEAARAMLIAKGFNPHTRFHFLFRRQIAKIAGVTAEEMEAYNFYLAQERAKFAEECNSLRARLNRFFRSLGLKFA